MPFAKQESLLGTNVVGHMEERCKMTFEWVWLKLNKRQVYILDKRYLQNVGMIFYSLYELTIKFKVTCDNRLFVASLAQLV